MALDIEGMQAIQRELQEKYRDKWEPIDPQRGLNKLMWLTGEVGEAAQIIKRRGWRGIMEEPDTRHAFIEELCDVMMYLNDVCLCYGITPEELETIYRAKHERNMRRW